MADSAERLRRHLPLRSKVLHILLAMASGERHGYGIKKRVESSTEGLVRMGPGTLYETLHQLEERRFIGEVPAPSDAREHAQRRYYELTGLGRGVLEAEMQRLEKLVHGARKWMVGRAER